MSSEALGHAWRYSEHKNATFLVLIAVADIVNDQNENQFWMSVGNLSLKTRLSISSVKTSLKELENTGWLVRVEQNIGETVRYKFVFDESRMVNWDSRVVKNKLGGSQTLTRGWSKSGYNTNITKNNLSGSNFEKTPIPPPFDSREYSKLRSGSIPMPEYLKDQLRK